VDRIALAERLGLALAIGLFVGIERFWVSRSEPEGSRIAGVRSFALAGLLGGLWGVLADAVEPVLLGFAALGFAALIVVAYARETRAAGAVADRGITTEIAALVVFALGIVAVRIDMALAAASGVVTVALLWFKADLHRTIAGLDAAEIGAAIRLLLISVVLLPLLPDRGYGPGGALNPYELWWMVVLVAGVSFAGYVATRLVGGARGIVATARLLGDTPGAAGVIALALAVNTLGKLAIVGWIADRALLVRVAIVVAATLAGGGAGAVLTLQARVASAGALDQVVAERGLDDAARLADREAERRVLERADHHAAAEFAEIAARRFRRAIGMLPRERAEILAAADRVGDLAGKRHRIVLAAARGRAHGTLVHQKYVRRADVLGHRLLLGDRHGRSP